MSFPEWASVKASGWLVGQFIERWRRRPVKTQDRMRAWVLSRMRGSAFARDHGIDGAMSLQELRRAVPIGGYEALEPYIKRILAGEGNVLGRAGIWHINMTSGTTGEPKFIPVTLVTQVQETCRLAYWTSLALRDHPRLYDGYCFAIVGRAIDGRSPVGIPFGHTSGMTLKSMPWIFSRKLSVPYEVTDVRDYDIRYYLTARLAMARPLSYIVSPNPAALIRISQVAQEKSESILRGIRDGTLGETLPLDADVSRRLERELWPDPDRARALERVASAEGGLLPRAVWPELAMIGCWLGGTVGLQAARLARHFGEVPCRDLGYLASEGHFSIPMEDGTPVGLLDLEAAFYEFIPEEDLGSPDPQVLTVGDLEAGKRYALIVSTLSGLLRYDIKDIIEVVGFLDRSPLVTFLQKGQDICDIVGEKLHANQVMMVMRSAAFPEARIECYRLVACPDEDRYHLLVECDGPPPPPATLTALAEQVDRGLIDLNVRYKRMRDSRRLEGIIPRVVKPGWSARIRKAWVDRGRSESQFKWRVVASSLDPLDREFLEEAGSPPS